MMLKFTVDPVTAGTSVRQGAPRMDPNQKDREYWERHSRGYDRSLTLLSKPLPRMLELTSNAVTGATRVLEVAAGTGLVTAVIARAAQEVVATDYSSAMVVRAGASAAVQRWWSKVQPVPRKA